MDDWAELEAKAREKAIELGEEYSKRLEFEIKEITKQANNQYWLDLVESGKKFEENKAGLVIAYVLGITDVDPIKEDIPHDRQYQPDFPDIDLDFLPFARDPIKEYITNKYGDDRVCSVGSWLTYKPRLALKDAARALPCPDDKLTDNQFISKLYDLLDSLPKEFDDISNLNKAKDEYPDFKEFAEKYPNLVRIAYRMIGRIKTQGKHAGGLIISSVPIGQHVPLTYDHKNNQSVSSWTEGFNQQLSKFGFVKFDLLGLRTMQDIFVATEYVKENRGVEFDWEYMYPSKDVLGRYREEDGDWQDVRMDDEAVLDLCNTQKVETVFQFETDFAMSILQEVGIKSFWDVMAATSLGRPGPMEQIPTYVSNRDDPSKRWKGELPDDMVKILEPTHGVIIYQEQLQKIWTDMCGLSVPEAEKARKAVAKKKSDQLMKLEPRIVKGLSKYVDEDWAKDWWERMTKFGRYAFNKSHAAAYSVISWRCLFLKAHFPIEWWASVLSHTKPDKRAKYVGLARVEGIEFGPVDINNLRTDFHVKGDKILPGLKIMKGIGKKTYPQLTKYGKTDFRDVDEFMEAHSEEYVNKNGKKKIRRLVNKTVMARLIQLGAFDHVFENRKALWQYYVYKYTKSNDKRKDILKNLKEKFEMSQEEIEEQRQKMIKDWRKNPRNKNKKNPPKRITTWKPKRKKYNIDHFLELNPKGYSLDDLLKIEQEFFGFFWHSPMELYVHNNHTVEDAKHSGELECVIQNISIQKSQRGNEYFRLTVTDGLEEARLMVFQDQIVMSDQQLFNEGVGIRASVKWSDKYKSFSCERGKQLVGLIRKDEYEQFYSDPDDIGDGGSSPGVADDGVDIEDEGFVADIVEVD